MKKWMSKLCAATLILVLALNGTQVWLGDALCAAFAWMGSASAEETTPLAEAAFSIGEAALGEERMQSPWKYAIRETDGYAVITGYDGEAAETLKLPDQLGGTDVVGIASGALALSGLKHVSIGVNISVIASDAFGAVKPTIHARNGSYALYYAQKSKLRSVNETEHTLSAKVVDFTQAPAGHIVAYSASYVELKSLEAMQLSVGSIFYIGNSGAEYDFFKVTALENKGEWVIAHTCMPEIGEAIIDMHVSGTVDIAQGTFIPADGVVVEHAGKASRSVFTDEQSYVYSLVLKTPITLPAKAPWLSGADQVEFKFDSSVKFSGNLSYVYHITDGVVTKASYTENITLTVNVKIAAEKKGKEWNLFSDENEKVNQRIVKIRQMEVLSIYEQLGKLNISFAGIGSATISLGAGIKIVGEVEYEYKTSWCDSYTYNPGTAQWEKMKDPIAESEEPSTSTLNFLAEGKIYAKATVAVKLLFVSVLELEGEIGVRGTLENAVGSGEEVVPCAEVKIGVYVEIEASCGLWVEWQEDAGAGIKKEIFKWEKECLGLNFHVGLFPWHWSKNCPYTQKVIVQFETKTQETIPSIYAYRYLPLPMKSEYALADDAQYGQFLGWSTDMAAVTPDWVFDSQQHLVRDSMTLYAVWENQAEVKFDSNGGTDVESQWAPVGGYIAKPANPFREKYDFVGWQYITENGTLKNWYFGTDKVPEGGITLYAKWMDEEGDIQSYTEGTKTCFYIGTLADINLSDYGNIQSGEDYLTFSRVTLDGEVIGVTITGVKNDPVNLVITDKLTETVTERVQDAEGNWKDVKVKYVRDVINISASAFDYCKSLKSVRMNLPDNILMNDAYLFAGCTSLEYVDLMDVTMNVVPASAFKDCVSLKCALLPKGISRINAYAFAGCQSLSTVVIPEGITIIEQQAFSGCSAMEEVSLAEGVLSIGDSALSNCASLEELYIPDSVGTIGNYVIAGCTGLKKLSIGGVETITSTMFHLNSSVLEEVEIRGTVKQLGYSAFSSTASYSIGSSYRHGYDSTSSSARLIIAEGVETIGTDAFRNCDVFTEVELPGTLTSIGNYAFATCDRLESIKWDEGNGSAQIGSYAFNGCTSLEAFKVPGQVTIIEGQAFEGCTGLKQIELPEGLQTIGNSAFNSCTSLEELYIPDSVGTIGNYMITGCTGLRKLSIGGVETITSTMFYLNSSVLEEVEIRGTVKQLGYSAFSSTAPYAIGSSYRHGYDSTSSSARLIIAEGVETIGTDAFRNCDVFTEVELPGTLTSIGNYAFAACDRLERVEWAEGNTSAQIGSYAFHRCTSIEAFKVPGHVTIIEGQAFEGCTSLKQIELPEGLQTIDDLAFDNCASLEELYIPDSVGTIGDYVITGCTGMKRLSIGGVETITSMMFYLNSSVLEEVEIRGTVKQIGYSAFSSTAPYAIGSSYRHGYDSTSSSARLIIAEGVETIGTDAFRNCDVFTEVELPGTLTSIGNYAFAACDRLESIKWDEGNGSAQIGSYAFNGCTSLEVFKVPGHVTIVDEHAFEGCTGLKQIELPEGLQTIDDLAFDNCTSLEELYIPDSVRTIGNCIITGCTGLRKLSIGGVETITSMMFYLNSSVLEEVEIRGTVKQIGYSAFSSTAPYAIGSSYRHGYDSTSSSARLIIAEGVETIGSDAFRNCDVFTEVELPGTLTSIGSNAFTACDRLTSLHISANAASIHGDAFAACTSLVVYTDAANTAIQEYFSSKQISVVVEGRPAYALTLDANGGMFAEGDATRTMMLSWGDALMLPADCTNASQLFCGWYMDADCTLPSRLLTMPARPLTLYAGWDIDCYTAELRGLPDSAGGMNGTRTIRVQAGKDPTEGIDADAPGYGFTGWYTDLQCTHSFSGEMPEHDLTLYAGWRRLLGIEYAEDAQRGEATLLHYNRGSDETTTVYLPSSMGTYPLMRIAAGAFSYEGITKLVLPATIMEIEQGAFDDMPELAQIEVSAENPVWCSINGILFAREPLRLVYYPAMASVRCTLAQGTVEIGEYAFADSRIAYLTLCEGLEKIGAHALAGTNITQIALPESLTEIGEYAFAKSNLAQLTLPSGLKTIGKNAFWGCEGIQTVTAPESLMEIGENAFEACAPLMALYGPLGECAMRTYASTYGHFYNLYKLQTVMPDGTQLVMPVEAGQALSLPLAPATDENRYFTGWYMDPEWTQAWLDTAMPAQNLTLYGAQAAIYAYETVLTPAATEGEAGEESLKLTAFLPAWSEAIVPERIGGIPVTQIAAGCFGENVMRVTIPASVTTIEAGAIPADASIICSAGTAAERYAQENGLTHEAMMHTLTFVTKGATVKPQAYAAGEAVTLGEAARSGYTFTGWYEEEEAIHAVPLQTDGTFVMPDADMTLYAGWVLEDETQAVIPFTYVEKDGCIEVTGLAEGTTQLVIPETLHGMPVTSLSSSAFRGEETLESISIPGSIRTIAQNAFRGCTSLTAVTLGEGVQTLKDHCFYGCSQLQTMDLPESVETICAGALAHTGLTQLTLGSGVLYVHEGALDGCKALEAIWVSSQNGYYVSDDGVLYDSMDSMMVKYPPMRAAQSYAVQPGTVQIAAGAFDGAYQLRTITLPESVQAMGKEAFSNCTGLTSMPEMGHTQITAIAERAFCGCSGISEIVIPDTITSIGEKAFYGCSHLLRATVPATVLRIDTDAFATAGMRMYAQTGSAAEAYAVSNHVTLISPDMVLPESISVVEAENDALTLEVGESCQLHIACTPSEASASTLYWSSEDETIATISESGLLYARREGETRIHAQSAAGCETDVLVCVSAPQTLYRVLMDVQELTLLETETAAVKVGVLPAHAADQTLNWHSTNEAVATVDGDGVITAVSRGEAQIQVTSTNGCTDTCTITVLPRVQQILLSVDGEQGTIHAGDVISISAQVLPKDAADQRLIWFTDDPDTAVADENGNISFKRSGYITLTVTAADCGTVSSTMLLECIADTPYRLPGMLREVGEEAFEATPVEHVIVPEGTTAIGARAFANCDRLYRVDIPQSVTEIAEDAFDGDARLTIVGAEGTAAQAYAWSHGIPFLIAQK